MIIFSGGVLDVMSGKTVVGAIISGGTMELIAGAIASGGITFAGIGGTLRFDTTASGTVTGAVISGFTPGDTPLPIGLQLLAAPFEEDKLLRVARMYERATDWHTRRPPL